MVGTPRLTERFQICHVHMNPLKEGTEQSAIGAKAIVENTQSCFISESIDERRQLDRNAVGPLPDDITT